MSEDARTRAARRHFDRWSNTYEQDRVSRRLRQIQQHALGLLALGPQDEFLDVGCGTGAAVREAAPQVSVAIGVDLSEGMIGRARELARELPNARFELGASDRLPLGDGAVSAVLCTTAFHHFPSPELAVAEMMRVLAPAGRLVIGDANADRAAVKLLDLVLRVVQRSHVGFCPPSKLKRTLGSGGMHDLTVTTVFDGYYAFVRGVRA